MYVDLHMHSTFSDGRYTPEMLVEENFKLGIRVIALTDHDCIDGVESALRAAEKFQGAMRIIPGLELSTEANKRPVHILGYYVDMDNNNLLDVLHWLRDSRENRLLRMLDKLQELGYDIKPEYCMAGGRSLGRPHVAKALVKAGYFNEAQEAFDKLLYFGGPAYTPYAKLFPEDAVKLIHEAGGLAVLAHPTEIENDDLVLSLLDKLPFDGLEVYHPSALTKERQEFLKKLAQERNLLITGGTDFHGVPDRFPAQLGEWIVNYEDVKEILAWQ